MLDIMFYKKYNQYLCSVPDDFCLEFRANYRELEGQRGVLTVRPEVPAYEAMLVYCTFPHTQNRQCWGVTSVKESDGGTSLLLQSAPYMGSWADYNKEITLSIPEDARIIQYTRYAHAAPRVVYLYVGGTAPPMDEKAQAAEQDDQRLTLLTPTIIDKIYLPGHQAGVAREPSIDGNGTTMPTACIARVHGLRNLSRYNLVPYTGTITVDKKTGQILSRQDPKYSFKTLWGTVHTDPYYKMQKELIQKREFKAYEIIFKANRFDLKSRDTRVALLKKGIFLGKGLVIADVDLLHPLESIYTITAQGDDRPDNVEEEITVPWDSISLDDNEIVRLIIQHKIKERAK